MVKRLLHCNYIKIFSWKRHESYYFKRLWILNRFLSEDARGGSNENEKCKSANTELMQHSSSDDEIEYNKNAGSKDDLTSRWKWKEELAWFTKALQPAFLHLYKWASAPGSSDNQITPPSTMSLSEVFNKLQLNKAGVQDWSLSDLMVGYLIYLSQTSARKVDDFAGVQITSDIAVQELIYHIELAKGAYKDSATSLAKYSMLREKNVVKFVKHSSVLRPGFYVGIDTRNKLVIFGIRGTHTVYDFVTDVISTSDQEMTFDGFSTHFGTAEAAQWYLRHEIDTIRRCLDKHKGYRLRIVGHSLGGAAAALLAIMLRRKSKEELGFSPDIVSAIGFGTPPCVSKLLAENCANYVSTVVLQDDIVPRLSVASLARLRNEILETDWMAVLEREDWKGIVDLVTNAKQFVSLVQDVTQKIADYTKFTNMLESSGKSAKNDSVNSDSPKKKDLDTKSVIKSNASCPEELFIPGTVYFIKRNTEEGGSSTDKSKVYYTLLKRNPGEHFQKILLSGNLISDHRCNSHYTALRDVLKSLPASDDRVYF